MRAESTPTKELRGSPARANRAVVSKLARLSTEGEDNTGCARDNQDVAQPSSSSVDRARARLALLLVHEMPALPRAVLEVLLVDAERSEDGTCDPSLAEIAARARMSVRSAQYGLRMLEGHGWIATVLRPLSLRWHDTSLYRILPAGRPWDRQRALRTPPRPFLRRSWGAKPGTDLIHPSTPSGLDRADAGDGLASDVAAPPPGGGLDELATSSAGERGREGGDDLDAALARDRAEVDALFAIVDDRTPQAQDGAVVSEGGTPEGGASAPSETARASEKTTPQVIREQMQACSLGDLCGAGFERKLWMLGIRKKLALPDLLAVIAIVGSKRQAAIFDANGGETKFQGDPSLVRGYVFRCIENQRLPKPVILREPERRIPRLGSAGALYGSDRRAHGGPPMEERSLSDCARRIHDALRAEYHGEKPLADIATPQLAMHLAQRSEDAACGGTLTTDDVVETLRAYATNLAFKLKRHDVIPTPGALKAFVTKEVREAKRGCAATLKPRTDAAKFYPARQRIDTRQPGTTMDHLRVPTPEITPAEMDELKDIFK